MDETKPNTATDNLRTNPYEMEDRPKPERHCDVCGGRVEPGIPRENGRLLVEGEHVFYRHWRCGSGE